MIAPLFVLDGPQYHELKPGQPHTFRGVVLALEGDPLTKLEVVRNGQTIATAVTGIATPELASLLVPGAASCRYECEAVLDDHPVEIRAGTADGALEPLFYFDPPGNELAHMRRVAARVFALPAPPPELLATTQGGSNVLSYVNSAVSGLFSLRTLLSKAGHDPESIESVLDVGCGTGRSLIGWHADDRKRLLAGADINASLIGWSRRELPGIADWRVSNVAPPLDFVSESFDLIQLASVFTHLPLPLQHSWLAELRRLIRPGGSVVITLHGELYVHLMLDDAAREGFERAGGHAEFAAAEAGANAFSTFHSHAFAVELFGDHFREVRWYPRGNDPVRPSLFPFAALQDVYVLRA